MAPCAFSSRQTVQRDVVVSTESDTYVCHALIDADFWPSNGVPLDFGGFLELPKPEWEALARSDRLVLKLRETGELYRMIFDSITGRFIARQL
jgi:hypothetical protein